MPGLFILSTTYVLSSANEARFVGQRLLSIKPCWLDLIIFLAYNSLWIQSCISFAVTLPRTNISGECYTANSALAHQFILSKPLLFFSYPVTYWIWPYFSLFCHHLRVIAKCSYITVGVCNQYFLRMSLSWVMVDSLLMHGLWIHYWICFPCGILQGDSNTLCVFSLWWHLEQVSCDTVTRSSNSPHPALRGQVCARLVLGLCVHCLHFSGPSSFFTNSPALFPESQPLTNCPHHPSRFPVFL